MHRPVDIDAAFLSSLLGEDELGVVVRAHIHIEAQLNELLRVMVSAPDLLPRMRFEQRVNLAGALGLDPGALPPLKELANIRNAFGHRHDVSLTTGMVQQLWDALSHDDKDAVLAGYETTRHQFPERQMPAFERLGPRDKFIPIAAALHKLVISARLEVAEGGPAV